MRLLNLVKEDDRVGLTADGFGELPPFVIAYISRRRTDKASSGELLLIFAHVDTGEHRLVIEEDFGQGLCQLGLPHPSGTQEDERTDGSLGVLETCTATAYGIGHRLDGLLLPHDTLVQLFLEVQELLALTLEHLPYGDTRPA